MRSSEGGRRGESGSPSRSLQSYSREHRLAHGSDYRRVYSQGRRITVSSATLFLLDRARKGPSGLETGLENGKRPRLGVTVTRKVGGAVVRNRLKRRIREIFRRNRVSITGGWDIVVNLRPGSQLVPYGVLEREILGALRRAALIRG